MFNALTTSSFRLERLRILTTRWDSFYLDLKPLLKGPKCWSKMTTLVVESVAFDTSDFVAFLIERTLH